MTTRHARIALFVLIAVFAWRLCAATWIEAKRVSSVPAVARWRSISAPFDQRLRWTLGQDYPLFVALSEHAAETTDVVLYAAATGVPREDMERRVLLLENRLRELLFPMRVFGLVGPVSTPSMRPRPKTPPALVANLTPSEPVPEEATLERLERGPGFELFRSPGS